MKAISVAAACATLVTTVTAAVDPIVIKGTKFFYKTNGTQFFMKGVAYQQEYSGNGTVEASGSYTDPLANTEACMRDIPYLVQLSTNTIRVYAVDPTRDHSTCMNALADAGIYVIADLSAPIELQSINRDNPAWNDDLYARYTAVVDDLSQYTNTLGFFAGNEVSNQPNNTEASAFVKAAVRDTKAYIAKSGSRPLYVGYATNDDADIRVDLADYFNCGDAAAGVDFWGYNIYSWCGDSSYTESGFDVRTKEFASFSVPAFFAEYGCNQVQPRTFSEVNALYGSQMTPVWSGGIVYMYFQEANDYGLVSIDSSGSVQTLADFDNLSSRLATVTPTGVRSGSYSPSNSPAACPSLGADWNARSSPLPPTPNQELCSCMYNSLGCAVSGDVSSEEYGDLFGTVCGLNDGDACKGIAANASTGVYGAYSMCNSTQQLSYIFNQYYESQDSAESACDFNGAAVLKNAAESSGTCSALIDEAGTDGTGTVTSQPTGTGAGAAANGGRGGSASSSGAGSSLSVHHVQVGAMSIALGISIAALSGAAMIML